MLRRLIVKRIRVLGQNTALAPRPVNQRKTCKKLRLNHRLFYEHGYMREEIEALDNTGQK
jgi:hypothetical protein